MQRARHLSTRIPTVEVAILPYENARLGGESRHLYANVDLLLITDNPGLDLTQLRSVGIEALTDIQQDPNLSGLEQRSNRAQAKIVVEISTGLDTPEEERTIKNALETALRLNEAGHDVRLIFDGAGTKCLSRTGKPDSRLYETLSTLKDLTPAACRYCAAVFEVEKAARDAGIILLDDYHNHSNLTALISEKYEKITF